MLTDRYEAAAAADDIRAELGGGIAFTARHDVTSESDWADVIALASSRLGALSVLVNNAGIVLTGSVADVAMRWCISPRTKAAS